MTKIILFVGIFLVVVNTIIGLLISKYLSFNWLSVDALLIINTILLFKLSTNNISNGYKVSLSFIYPFLCFITIVLAVLSPDKFFNNYYVICCILITLIEISLLIVVRSINTINKK